MRIRRKAVRCIDCGFLQRRHMTPHGSSGEPVQVTLRERGSLRGAAQTSDVYLCYKEVAPLHGQAVDLAERLGDTEGKLPQAYKAVLKTLRSCPYWFPFTPGFGLQEHLRLQQEREAAERQTRGNLRAALVGGVLGGVLGGGFALLAVVLTQMLS